MPALELRRWEVSLRALSVLKTTLWLALWLRQWPVVLIAFPLGLWEYWTSRPRAVHFPLGLRTVGELVLCMTSFREHKESGYRWTRNEIAMKVRLIIAASLGLPLNAVQPETTWTELADGGIRPAFARSERTVDKTPELHPPLRPDG